MKQETYRFRLSSGEDVLITTNEIIDLIEGHWRWTPEAKTIKRNKQVDVPTEAWQKSVDRKLEYANNTIVPLIAYLSAHHDFDISKFNEWKKEYIDAIKE